MQYYLNYGTCRSQSPDATRIVCDTKSVLQGRYMPELVSTWVLTIYDLCSTVPEYLPHYVPGNKIDRVCTAYRYTQLEQYIRYWHY
eukprot:SAG11_NODE_584_length_8351_cov_159.783568_6_plen_86_part_00